MNQSAPSTITAVGHDKVDPEFNASVEHACTNLVDINNDATTSSGTHFEGSVILIELFAGLRSGRYALESLPVTILSHAAHEDNNFANSWAKRAWPDEKLFTCQGALSEHALEQVVAHHVDADMVILFACSPPPVNDQLSKEFRAIPVTIQRLRLKSRVVVKFLVSAAGVSDSIRDNISELLGCVPYRYRCCADRSHQKYPVLLVRCRLCAVWR